MPRTFFVLELLYMLEADSPKERGKKNQHANGTGTL